MSKHQPKTVKPQEWQPPLVNGRYQDKSGRLHTFSNDCEKQIALIAARADHPPVDFSKYLISEKDGTIYLETRFALVDNPDYFQMYMAAVERCASTRRESERRRREHEERMAQYDTPAVDKSPSAEQPTTGDTFFEGLANAIAQI